MILQYIVFPERLVKPCESPRYYELAAGHEGFIAFLHLAGNERGPGKPTSEQILYPFHPVLDFCRVVAMRRLSLMKAVGRVRRSCINTALT